MNKTLNDKQIRIAVRDGIEDFFKYINKYMTFEQYTIEPNYEGVRKQIEAYFYDSVKERYEVKYKVPGLRGIREYEISKSDVEIGVEQLGPKMYEEVLKKAIHPNQIDLFNRLSEKYNFELSAVGMDYVKFELALKHLRLTDSKIRKAKKV